MCHRISGCDIVQLTHVWMRSAYMRSLWRDVNATFLWHACFLYSITHQGCSCRPRFCISPSELWGFPPSSGSINQHFHCSHASKPVRLSFFFKLFTTNVFLNWSHADLCWVPNHLNALSYNIVLCVIQLYRQLSPPPPSNGMNDESI